jgi:NAD(P)-dependent dehydrogenase (short-subunit alcohol dehydrogenase family)
VNQRFKEQVAIVTGGAGGLGRAVAQRLADEGARVVIADQNEAAGHLAAAHLPEALAITTDIGDPTSVAALVEQTLKRYGQIDILVNNAAITGKHPAYQRYGLLDTPLDFWRWLTEINLTAQFICLQTVARAMATKRRGAIVNVSSIAGLLPTPGDFTYSIGKAAVLMLTRCAAAELGQWNIRVNAVAPSGMLPPGASQPPISPHNLVGRVADYTDIADVIAFLCSAESRFVDGQIITIDGGESVAARHRWRAASNRADPTEGE